MRVREGLEGKIQRIKERNKDAQVQRKSEYYTNIDRSRARARKRERERERGGGGEKKLYIEERNCPT